MLTGRNHDSVGMGMIIEVATTAPGWETSPMGPFDCANWVQIDLGPDDHDHLISPDERLSFAMARQ